MNGLKVCDGVIVFGENIIFDRRINEYKTLNKRKIEILEYINNNSQILKSKLVSDSPDILDDIKELLNNHYIEDIFIIRKVIWNKNKLLMVGEFFVKVLGEMLFWGLILNFISGFYYYELITQFTMIMFTSIMVHELGHILVAWILNSENGNGIIINRFNRIIYIYKSNNKRVLKKIAMSGSIFSITYLIMVLTFSNSNKYIVVLFILYNILMITPLFPDGKILFRKLSS